jgi:hypothetical protein
MLSEFYQIPVSQMRFSLISPLSRASSCSPKARKARWLPCERLRELIEDAIVDTYTESERRTGLFIMIEDHLALPFDTELGCNRQRRAD